MRTGIALLVVALSLSGCATQADPGPSDAAEMAQTLAGRVAGPAQRCISTGTNITPQIVGESLVYREGGRLWVSATVGGCPSLRGDPITIVEVNGGQLCANDRFRTIERVGIGIPGPYCRFGMFVPWKRERR